MSNNQDNELLFKLIIQGINNLSETTDKMDKRLDNIDRTMDKNTLSLDEHMRRTDLIESQLNPIRSAYDWVIISGKVIGVLALVVTIIGGVFKAAEFILEVVK